MAIENDIVVTINDVAFGGEGVARNEDKVIFIPHTLPGEKVRIEITEEKKNFSKGKLVEVLEPSPNRQEAKCPFFGPCLGCAYLHVDYEAQLQLKKKQVEDLFKRIGKLQSIPSIQVVPSPSPLAYRNKIKMHVEKQDADWKVGFIGEDNKTIVDIKQCLIARPEINERLQHFREEVDKEPKAMFRGVWLARSSHKEKVKDFFFEKGKEQGHRKEKDNLADLPLIKEEVKGKNFLSPFESFFQTNPIMIEKMVETVEPMLELSKDSLLIDAYCGVGLFSLLFASKANRVIGIEEDWRAIGCAQKNARILFVKNARFVGGKVEQQLESQLKENAQKDVKVLLDPPRIGCQPKVLETLLKSKVPQIVYVSCNPSTLARDLGVLCAKDYQLKQVTLLDMFPQTSHIEIVCQLIRS